MQTENNFLENKHRSGKQILCFECHTGTFVKIEQPSHGDYNTDGKVPRICNDPCCNTLSDQVQIIHDKGTDTNPLSHNYIDTVLTCIFVSKRYDLKFRKQLYRFLREKTLYHPYDLAGLIYAEMISKGYLVSFDFILKVTYSKFKPMFSFRSN